MSRSTLRTLAVLVAGVGAACVLLYAAATGPAYVLGEQGDSTTTGQRAPADDEPQQRDDESDEPRGVGDAGSVPGLVTDLVTALVVVVALWFLAVLTRAVLLRLQRRLPERALDVPLAPLSRLAALREAMAEAEPAQREELAAGEVRDAIVRCWVRFEEAAARAGVPRLASETTAEHVVRLLHALDVDPRPVGVLAGLYREARFSSHPLGEEVRRRAEAALTAVHGELLAGVAAGHDVGGVP